MKKFDVVFKNGKIVTENGVEECDIGVTDGKISARSDHSFSMSLMYPICSSPVEFLILCFKMRSPYTKMALLKRGFLLRAKAIRIFRS